MEYTITETYTLPSKGAIYGSGIDPRITLRSMTTEEEMRRLSPSDVPYKNIADIIDACIVNKPGISAYDMCIGDFQFLLHKLRTVTYGPEYLTTSMCPLCGNSNSTSSNLDELDVVDFTDDFFKLLEVDLPKSGKHIRLKYQTPRKLDNIELRKKELLKRNAEQPDPSLLLTLESVIDTIDGVKIDAVKLPAFLKSLPMADTNILLQTAHKIDSSIGVDINIHNKCSACGYDYTTFFRITQEFFRPSIY